MPLGAATHGSVEWTFGTLSFLEAGAPCDPAILLLHGVGSCAHSWRDQLSDFSRRGLRVIAWDQPGYGRSDPPPMAGPSPADYADAVETLADALDFVAFYSPRSFALTHFLHLGDT